MLSYCQVEPVSSDFVVGFTSCVVVSTWPRLRCDVGLEEGKY